MATGTSLRAAVVTIVAAASWTASHRPAAAADALIANPRTQPITITASDLGSHSVALGVGKSVVIDLPHDIKDVLVGDPKIANAVIRSARRAYIVGNGVGQTNVYFFDAEGRQMAGFDIAVTRDLNGIRAAIRQVLPEADIRVEGIGEGVVLSGTASSQAEAQQAYDIAVRLLGAGHRRHSFPGQQGRQRHHRARPRPDHAQGDSCRGRARHRQAAWHQSLRHTRLRHGCGQFQQHQSVLRQRPAAQRLEHHRRVAEHQRHDPGHGAGFTRSPSRI
jgi:Pilus formation protein N terminal region/BON domain